MNRVGFYIKIEVDKGQKTILEVASKLSQLLIGLANIDARFSDLYYLTKENKKNERCYPLDSSRVKLRNQLSNWILESNKAAIGKYNKGVIPTIDFSEPVGFVNTFMTPNKNENKTVLWTTLGSDRYNHLRLEIPKKRIESMEWYTSILKVFIQTFNPNFGGVFLDVQLKNNPLYFPGLITYMRQDFDKPHIPDFVNTESFFNGELFYLMDKVWDSSSRQENEFFKTFLLRFYDKNAAANNL